MTNQSLRSQINSRAKRGLGRMPSSTRERGNNFVPSNKLLPFTDEREAAAQFSAVVHDFSAGQLAQLARCTKGTAKNWKAGRVFPNGAKLLNLATNCPIVNAWVHSKIGRPEFDCPRTVHETINALQFAASLPGPAGDEARAILSGKTR